MARPGQVWRLPFLIRAKIDIFANLARCVDFSKTVDFAHLRTTFNLSSGSKSGLCGHGTSGLEDCCHCLRLIAYPEESTTGPYSIDLSRFYNDSDFFSILVYSIDTSRFDNDGKHFIWLPWFQVLLPELSTSLIQLWSWKGSQMQFSKMHLWAHLPWRCWKVCLVN